MSVLNLAQVAELLDCSEDTVADAVRAGKLPSVRYGRSPRVPYAALMKVLEEQALANLKPSPEEGRSQEVTAGHFRFMGSLGRAPMPRRADFTRTVKVSPQS